MKFRVRGVIVGGVTYKHLVFMCPGCETIHAVNLPGDDGTRPDVCWDWDSNVENPTITPSILVRAGSPERCHSYVEQGRIRFLGDCSHRYAGQTVDVPELPEYLTDTELGDAPR